MLAEKFPAVGKDGEGQGKGYLLSCRDQYALLKPVCILPCFLQTCLALLAHNPALSPNPHPPPHCDRLPLAAGFSLPLHLTNQGGL